LLGTCEAYIEELPETTYETATVTIAPDSSCRFDVISAVISITAMGTFPAAAKKLIMPIMTDDAVADTRPGKRYLKIVPMDARGMRL